MAVASQSPPGRPPDDQRSGSRRDGTGSVATPSPASPRAEPRLAFRTALGRYKATRLAAIRLAQGSSPDAERIRPAGSAAEITEHLDQPAAVAQLVARLPIGARMALSLLALTETASISVAGMTNALGVLGPDPESTIVRLLDLGLLAIEPDAPLGPVDDLATALRWGNPAVSLLRAHPAVPHGVRTARPEESLPTAEGPISQVRESDGLEPVLRLGALWQRAVAEPLRQTQQGSLYKRDRERIDEDPALVGPIADAIAPLPDPASLWLALARRVGMIVPDPSGERLLAAPPEFWADNAVHLPQMVATGWMGLETWHDRDGTPGEKVAAGLAVPHLRAAVLLWLATLADADWVALDDLAAHLTARRPAWDRTAPVVPGPGTHAGHRRGATPRGRAQARAVGDPLGSSLLESILLGAGYLLGLVRAAEERGTRRRVVQLTPLGRYVLALGPSPPPRATFDHFLFVQPNFEVVAYRQGLTPHLVGRLSRFVWWSRMGAALELKLTRESILHGLDGGLTPESMLQVLERHSQRPLPRGVVDAIRSWADRRERVAYHEAATLVEFGSRDERDGALEAWPRDDRDAPIAVGERFLLVEDERSIPFERFRLTGSRDYGRPPEVCATVEADGVSITLDLARSDLLVDAELSRFADEVPMPRTPRGPVAEASGRRFLVTPGSLRRGLGRGMSPPQLAEWYVRRTGGEIPPAVRLMLAPRTSRVPALKAARMTVLKLPSVELLDGLLQHPDTGPWLGERLGPSSVAIPDDRLAPLRKALKDLGIEFESN